MGAMHVFALALFSLLQLARTASAASSPNIVFILIDDTGFNDIGYHNRSTPNGRGRILTPHIDKLADTGVKLSNYYVQPICTPTRAALMTGRYPFRYGVNGYTISADAPWGIPLNETFLPQFLGDKGYHTGMTGKWHLGFYKEEYLPMSRGFDEQSGIYNALADRYTHDAYGGYDWHRNQTTDWTLEGQYSGDLVRDNAVSFIRERSLEPHVPFFLYVPFQEAHSPYQAPQKYLDMYPEMASTPERQNLAGMVTHTDECIGDIVEALNVTGAYDNTIIFFSSDNGGPGGQEEVPKQSRFDPVVLDRNYPYRGQKHEVFEGGVRVAGLVHSPLLPDNVHGSTVDSIVHITDWLPTIIAATGASLKSREHLPLDGVDQWDCILGKSGSCTRNEVVLNFNTVCDVAGSTGGDYKTECPAPKAALRVGDMKILAECYDTASSSLTGGKWLYNLTADPSESNNLSHAMPTELSVLEAKLLEYGAQAALIPPLEGSPPWQGTGYYCAKCTPGRPKGKGRKKSWETWCNTPTGQVC